MRNAAVVCCALVALVLGASPASAADEPDHVPSAGGGGEVLAPERAAATPTGVPGIDVSHWNNKIRWPKVAASGIQFVIAKATEGTGFEDPAYLRNRTGAKAAGVVFTAYEFADPDTGRRDAIQDADHFLKVAKLTSDDMVPVLDLETTDGLSDAELLKWTNAWCDRVEATLGVRPMIYTSPSFWKERLSDSPALAIAGSRLWIAHWFAAQPTVPANNWSDTGYAIWQWSNKGVVDGIDGRTDLNVLFGASTKSLLIKNS